ncbi:biotin--[acetyl-CoA-carboxylase] ligase [Megasphaera cerevisiae]|jgi:BirA family biotin operon repressor/biotin-[acetyl-CoA-carboxylase] ligase|uniref:biotin--[acetyl-CoA-carboxylase] ligase n=1 Tax=Megasphaera cerevisiae TaxID=39029 RepID=UPI0009431C2B|nr:biotin--[acetyl-CoA-carboxylase] ligase [Megasphaera cerevisiae]OKY53006.1 biotin--[acetyl-CoA-carboxylase] ligase [Megasphaera cerevisiae]
MRQDILDYLMEHKDTFVSGQKISEMFGISRTAVWKHIRVLKQRGYIIESYTKRGYCLRIAPELLRPETISPKLKTKYFGKKIVYYEKVDSTNTAAKKIADKGAEEGTIVVAEEQTGGRGRLSRSFLSPFAQGIWFSIILRPTFPPMEVSKMTLVAAVALTKALRKMGLIHCGIKWPNDILVHDRKIVGILTELNASVEKINYMVMGIGINTALTKKVLPRDLKKTVTSFAIENVPVHRSELLQEVLLQLEHYYTVAQEQGFAPVLEEWKMLSCMLGKDVEVSLTDHTFTGKAVDLDENGNLVVETANGLEKVLAGDVQVRSV